MMLDVLSWDPERGEYLPQKKPKLQPACQFAVAEGMVVKSQSSEHVTRARSAVQELLLLNHPVDCPICDQAGECRLQDYWLEHQSKNKRMRDEPVHKPKGVVFGPTIVYDAERCIVCTRCIRVCEEVAKDPVLDMRERGNLTEIVVAPGRQLDHAYTLMTEYVCPVGALTAVDFRFKARVWFLRSARSVCTGCATGCSSFTDYDPRDQKVYRYRPRENLAVNQYWMCDEGMLDHQRVHERRLLEPRISGETTTREAALEKAASLLRGAGSQGAVVLSAEHSQEDNLAVAWLAREALGIKEVYVTGRPRGQGDDVLRHPDKNPNSAGVAALPGVLRPKSFGELSAALKQSKHPTVLWLGSQVPEAMELPAIESLVCLATHQGPPSDAARVLLPASSWAESDGTFVNKQGMAQQSDRAVRPQGASLPAWRWVQELARALESPAPYKKLDDLRAMLSGETKASPASRLDPGAPG